MDFNKDPPTEGQDRGQVDNDNDDTEGHETLGCLQGVRYQIVRGFRADTPNPWVPARG